MLSDAQKQPQVFTTKPQNFRIFGITLYAGVRAHDRIGEMLRNCGFEVRGKP